MIWNDDEVFMELRRMRWEQGEDNHDRRVEAQHSSRCGRFGAAN